MSPAGVVQLGIIAGCCAPLIFLFISGSNFQKPGGSPRRGLGGGGGVVFGVGVGLGWGVGVGLAGGVGLDGGVGVGLGEGVGLVPSNVTSFFIVNDYFN